MEAGLCPPGNYYRIGWPVREIGYVVRFQAQSMRMYQMCVCLNIDISYINIGIQFGSKEEFHSQVLLLLILCSPRDF